MSAKVHTHHVTSLPALFATFFALIVLTVLTVYLNSFELGRMDMVVTLGIAIAKAMLVALIFMQLLHDKLLNAVIVAGSLVFMAIFLSSTIFDSLHYKADVSEYVVQNPQAMTPTVAAAPAAPAEAAATP